MRHSVHSSDEDKVILDAHSFGLSFCRFPFCLFVCHLVGDQNYLSVGTAILNCKSPAKISYKPVTVVFRHEKVLVEDI